MREFHSVYSIPDDPLHVVDSKENSKITKKKPLRMYIEIHNGRSWDKKEKKRVTGRRGKTEVVIQWYLKTMEAA